MRQLKQQTLKDEADEDKEARGRAASFSADMTGPPTHAMMQLPASLTMTLQKASCEQLILSTGYGVGYSCTVRPW
jgi:hypothetical protein